MEKERRYDIDWIRVLAFDILILYHVGMFFVPWGWHIKNNQIVDWLTWPMLFVYGFILISLGDSFWTSIVKIKWISLLLGISLIPVTLWLWYNAPESILVPLAKTIQMWCWILVIFAFASIYLNRKSRVIEYRNKAVYPFYILHQTITVIIGYWLITNPMHYSFKFAILVAGTFGLSWLLYEFIIRRNRLIAVLFGLKRNNTYGKPQN